MFDTLLEMGFQVELVSDAQAILGVDFADAVDELETALAATTIPISEIIDGGGGEAKGRQRLRRALASAGWPKFKFTIEKLINGVARESVSHEIDHVRSFDNGTRIALEIEWNNKDPFYDRDLENFKRLHADGAISVGIIVTRGRTLHENMRLLVRRFLVERQIRDLDGIKRWGYDPTTRQRKAINQRMTRAKTPATFQDAFTDVFVADKFGEATEPPRVCRRLFVLSQAAMGN